MTAVLTSGDLLGVFAFPSQPLMGSYGGLPRAKSQPTRPLLPGVEYENAAARKCYHHHHHHHRRHRFYHAAAPLDTSHNKSTIADTKDPSIMSDHDSAIGLASSKPSSLRDSASARFKQYVSSVGYRHPRNMNSNSVASSSSSSTSSTHVRALSGSDCPPSKKIDRPEMLEALREFDLFPPVPRCDGDHLRFSDDSLVAPHSMESCMPLPDSSSTPSGRKGSYSLFPKSSQTDTLPLRCRAPELIALSQQARIATRQQLDDLWQTTEGRSPPSFEDDLIQFRVTRKTRLTWYIGGDKIPLYVVKVDPIEDAKIQKCYPVRHGPRQPVTTILSQNLFALRRRPLVIPFTSAEECYNHEEAFGTVDKKRFAKSTHCLVNETRPVDGACPENCTLSFDREHSRYELRCTDVHRVLHVTTASNVSGLTDLEITQAGDDRPLLTLDLPSKVLSLSMSHILPTLLSIRAIDFLVASAIFVAIVEDDIYTTTARRTTRRLPGLLHDPCYQANAPRRVIRASWRNKGGSTQAAVSNSQHHDSTKSADDNTYNNSEEAKPTSSGSNFSFSRFNGYFPRKLNSNESKSGNSRNSNAHDRPKHGQGEKKIHITGKKQTPKENGNKSERSDNDSNDHHKNKDKKKATRNRSRGRGRSKNRKTRSHSAPNNHTLTSTSNLTVLGDDEPRSRLPPTRSNTLATTKTIKSKTTTAEKEAEESSASPSHASLWDGIRMSLSKKSKKPFFARVVATHNTQKEDATITTTDAADAGGGLSSSRSNGMKSQRSLPMKLPPFRFGESTV